VIFFKPSEGWPSDVADYLGTEIPETWQRVAVKVHFGRSKRRRAGVLPSWVAPTVAMLEKRGCSVGVVDTNTLYGGERHTTDAHLAVAHKHGYPRAAILDGAAHELAPGISVPSDVLGYDGIVHFAHVTGHQVVGYGGALKGVGMGLAHRSTKLWVHHGGVPVHKPSACTACGRCVEVCAHGALSTDGISKDCVMCAACVGECAAVSFGWGSTVEVARRLAVAALRIDDALPIWHVAVGMDVTRLCDCMGDAQDEPLGSVGVWVGEDALEVDNAAMRGCWPLGGRHYSKERWSAVVRCASGLRRNT